jgi:hypothetical protein
MILLPGVLEGVTSRKDKTVKLTFGTQELTPADAGQIMAMANSFCFLALKPETFTQTEKEIMQQLKADNLTNNIKTPSQRLRAVLYVCFQNDGEGFNDFDGYYIAKINNLIEHFKKQLP